MDESYNFIINNKLIKDNDYVIAAISGGPDSMALLHLLITLRNKINFNIVCAHVNHNVREESKEEKKFVENYCKQNNIIFEYMKIEKYENGFHNEAIMRDKRYIFFKDLLKKYNSKLLFTAHHGDDLIETILMRIVRGSTLNGYAGFSKMLDMETYKIIRPLIFITKEEIIEYNLKNDIKYVTDKSNDDDLYTRNRYRHIVLPFLKKEDTNVHQKFLKFSEIILEYSNYVNNEMLKNIDKVYVNKVLYIDKFLSMDKLIQKEVLNYILKDIYKDDISLINDTHVKNIYNLIISSKPNSFTMIPNNINVVRNYDIMSFERNINSKEEYLILLDKDIVLPSSRNIVFKSNEESDSNYVCRLNSGDIKLPLYVRNKKDGDKMAIKNLNGSKKIKDIFIDEKISIKDRLNTPVVIDSNSDIVWLPGVKKSKYNKEKNEKYDIILKYN